MSGNMAEAFLISLSMDNPSTLLSMDTGAYEDPLLTRQMEVGRAPDINLPLTVDIYSPGQWLSNSSEFEALHARLDSQVDELAWSPPNKGKKIVRRSDTIWGAWFFFNHYFRPALKDKGREAVMLGELEKSDLRLDMFLVQHDMENMYMWAFKEKPENALGKMQLRSYMNGHSRFGEPQFPFSVEKGFNRSHRMQRKQYRGLSNPQCIHGIEVVRCPNFSFILEQDRKRWIDLTGRDTNLSISSDAESFSEWRSIPSPDLDSERLSLPLQTKPSNGSIKKPSSSSKISAKTNGNILNLSSQTLCQGNGLQLSSSLNKKRRIHSLEVDSSVQLLNLSNSPTDLNEDQEFEQPWLSSFSGVMTQASGPVTGAKSIYEDEKGYLIMVSLPFTDMHRVRVSWRNDGTHGVVKIHCTSTACAPSVTRGDRVFKLTDPNPEHCPPGDFVREIELETRIPENADLKAFYVEESAGLEIMVPKNMMFSEEREVRVFLPPMLGRTETMLC